MFSIFIILSSRLHLTMKEIAEGGEMEKLFFFFFVCVRQDYDSFRLLTNITWFSHLNLNLNFFERFSILLGLFFFNIFHLNNFLSLSRLISWCKIVIKSLSLIYIIVWWFLFHEHSLKDKISLFFFDVFIEKYSINLLTWFFMTFDIIKMNIHK